MGSGRLKAALAAFFLSFQAHALDPAAVEKLAFGDGDEKIEAIGALVAEGDPKAAELLKAFAEGELQTSGKRVLIVKGKDAFDAVAECQGRLCRDGDDGRCLQGASDQLDERRGSGGYTRAGGIAGPLIASICRTRSRSLGRPNESKSWRSSSFDGT